MKVIDFAVELHGNREVTVNGRPLDKSDAIIDERVIEKQMTPAQIWVLICSLRKLQAQMEHTYRRARVRHGEISDTAGRMKTIVSGALGIPGTNVLALPGAKKPKGG